MAQIPYRSALGFYKEVEEDRITLTVKGEPGALYVEIPSHLRNRLELVVGSRLRGRVESLLRPDGQRRGLDCPMDWEIEGYWHELHVPEEFARAYNVAAGDEITIVVEKVVNYGQEVPV
jgi:hypothetical protein